MKSCRTLQFLVRQHFLLIGRFVSKMLYEIHFTRYEACDTCDCVLMQKSCKWDALFLYENLLNFRGGRHG